MYQKYSTEAIVLGSRESGESDRVYALFTRDFGLVRARASAVRTERSRMRYALQNYAHTNVSLVRGKRGWRLAGSTAIALGSSDVSAITAFARISELVLRLVAGEEANTYLYETLVEAHRALRRATENTATIEIVSVARVLHSLGYLSAEALDSAILTHTAFDPEHMREAEEVRGALLSSINKAISETQL